MELVWSKGRLYLPSDGLDDRPLKESNPTIADCPSPDQEIAFDQGMAAIPGISDFHVHIHERIAGFDLADNLASFARLAQCCGIQAFGAFITETPDSDLKTQYRQYDAVANRHFAGNVRWHLTPVHSTVEDILPLLHRGCDLKFYTTYRAAGLYRSYEEIGRWMQDLSDLKPLILVHCEDDAIVTAAGDRNPFTHPRIHTLRRPPEAEIKAVDRLCDLSVRYGYPIHIVHVSTPQAARIIQSAKAHTPITCETSPNYLFLNDSLYDQPDAHRWIFTPPLRSESLRGELRELAQDGIFDIYATDHCPFTKADKDRHRDNLAAVPSGIAGSGALMPLLMDKLGVSPEHVVTRLCDNPARLMKLGDNYCQLKPGSIARFLMFSVPAEREDTGCRHPLRIKVAVEERPQENPYIPSQSDTYNPWIGQYARTIIHSSVMLPDMITFATNPVAKEH